MSFLSPVFRVYRIRSGRSVKMRPYWPIGPLSTKQVDFDRGNRHTRLE
jgi:hypothetical protein